jgi:SAM-dependent methyltransferase
VVVDFGAIHLMPDWRTGLGEVARVLRPGGRFFFEQPAHPLYGLMMPLSTSRRIAGGFGRQVLLTSLNVGAFTSLASLGRTRSSSPASSAISSVRPASPHHELTSPAAPRAGRAGPGTG